MTFKFVQEHIPEDASVGVALAYNSFVFPYFGRRLGRTLTIVDAGDVVPDDRRLDRGVHRVSRSKAAHRLGDESVWAHHGWTVWRRVGTDACPDAERLDSS